MDFRFADLPKLKEVDIDKGLVGFENNVFRQISSCASSLQTLSFTIPRPKKDFKLDFFPELPNVKTLTITIGARRDECLLEYASVANACPRLETFTVKLLWLSPIRSGREVRHFSTETHEHLKVFQILGYYGRISDFDLAAYVIENAVALKKVVIDPRHQDRELISEPAARGFSTCEQATRSCAKHQLLLILPPGVELVML